MSVERGYYYHFKGNLYKVKGVAKHTETNEELVLYTDDSGHLYARPLTSFVGKVKLEDKEVPRFEYIGIYDPRVCDA